MEVVKEFVPTQNETQIENQKAKETQSQGQEKEGQEGQNQKENEFENGKGHSSTEDIQSSEIGDLKNARKRKNSLEEDVSTFFYFFLYL